ncbi:ParB/RepB/Spo0J family partition protein [Pseudomonas cichorii]|nr:ParB/RepB/Spo0J family partition protein [Pseudomonas cichorii]MBX8493147.1 ParB/RepB/Spo0J family partition protein [Pseudomonas cichorii]
MSKSTAVRTEVPFQQLRISARNTRKGRHTEAHKAKVAELAVSIAQVGLLQNLVVHVNEEFCDVVAGGTRLEAIGQLVEDGRWPVEQTVPVMIIGIDEAIAASYTENSKRTAMHPADEYEAFVALTLQGWTIDKIADNFGVTPLVVERRIKLQAAAPELIRQFRDNLITTDQLIALCATDSHERQLDVWSKTGINTWARSPNNLRAAVMENEVEASSDPRIEVIGGIDAYERAGGTVRRDLFSTDGHGVILEDSGLVTKLFFETLEEIAEQYRQAGWKWVDIWPQWDFSEFSRFGRAPTTTVDLSAEDAKRLETLRTEFEAIDVEKASTDADQNFDRYSELEENEMILEEQIEMLEAKQLSYLPEVLKHCGVIVGFHSGDMRIEHGLVRTEDRVHVKEAIGEEGFIRGGRESLPAGRKSDSVSDALRQSLLGHKNLAAQEVTASNPHAAKVLLVSQMVTSVRSKPTDAPTDYGISSGWGTRSNCKISDEAGVEKQSAFEAMGETLTEQLPAESGALWDALYALPANQLDKLLAYAVARSVSLAAEPGRGMTDRFVSSLKLDMANHFTVTSENYLNRVSKELILKALDEAGKVKSEQDRTALIAMKKGALAKEAEERLGGTGWVPKEIRTVIETEQPTGKKPKRGAKINA